MVLVISDRYVKMRRIFYGQSLMNVTIKMFHFNRTEPTAHASRKSIKAKKKKNVAERLILLRVDVEWPARSFYLSHCNFFLGNYLNAKVYSYRPKTIDEIKAAVRQKIVLKSASQKKPSSAQYYF